MKRIFRLLIASFALLVIGVQASVPMYAACSDASGGITSGVSCVNPDKGSQAAGDLGTNIKKITNILVIVIIVAAVLMVVIGGLRYTLSGGNGNATKEAKDQILYAIIGIIVALLASAIVNFVVSKFVK